MNASTKLWTMGQIRDAHEGHWFDDSTMAFFGDTMASFQVFQDRGKILFYRRPSATVNVFGRTERVGFDATFFGVYEFDPDTGDIDRADDDDRENVISAISARILKVLTNAIPAYPLH